MNVERREFLGIAVGLFGISSGCAKLRPGRLPAGSLVVKNEDDLPHEATVTINSEQRGRIRYASIPVRPGEKRVFQDVITTNGSYDVVVRNEAGGEKRIPFEMPSREYVEVAFTTVAEMTVGRVTVES